MQTLAMSHHRARTVRSDGVWRPDLIREGLTSSAGRMMPPQADNGLVSVNGENVPPTRGDPDIRRLLEFLMLPLDPAQRKLLELIKKHPETLGPRDPSGDSVEGREQQGRLARGRTANSVPAPDADGDMSTAHGNAKSSPAVLLPLVVDYANGMTPVERSQGSIGFAFRRCGSGLARPECGSVSTIVRSATRTCGTLGASWMAGWLP